MHEGRAIAMQQIGIERREFAAFALIRHPHFFARIIYARAMEQEKPLAILGTIFLVERSNGCRGIINQCRITRQNFFIRINKIGEQAIEQVAVGIGEEANFKPFGQRINILRSMMSVGMATMLRR